MTWGLFFLSVHRRRRHRQPLALIFRFEIASFLPTARSQVSGLRSQVSGLRSQVSCFRFQPLTFDHWFHPSALCFPSSRPSVRVVRVFRGSNASSPGCRFPAFPPSALTLVGGCSKIRAHLCLVPIIGSAVDKIRVNSRNSRIKPFPVSAFPPSAFRFNFCFLLSIFLFSPPDLACF